MKKGLFVALLMVAVVAMAFPAFARAPIIKELPEIIIGDTGDLSGSGTSALRLYRYLNVLNLLDVNVIEWRNGYPLSKYNVFLYRNTGTDPINIVAANGASGTTLANTLSSTEYTNLVGSGTAPAAGANIVDSATTFVFLSLYNKTIGDLGVDPDPGNIYTATPAADGVLQSAATTAGGYGQTDLVLLAAETDLPTASPTLVAQAPLTVYTTLDSDDFTTGLFNVVRSYDFAGGSPQNWYLVAQGDAGYGAMTAAYDTTAGAAGKIGWDAAGTPAQAGYGNWYLSDTGTYAQFVIPAAGMEDQVYRCRMTMTTSGTGEASVCSYRISAQSFTQNHWSGILVLTNGGAEIEAPTASAPLDFQIHWAVPYDMNEWDSAGALAAPQWTHGNGTTIPNDARNYCISFDGIDTGTPYGGPDTANLLMDSCSIESYDRPATKATPDLLWGVGGIAFDNATDGFVTQTVAGFTGVALASSSRSATGVTLTIGTISSPHARWQQANQNPTATTQRYVETANDLVRYTVTCSSPAPNTCPNVRFQTTPILASTGASDTTIWYDNFAPGAGIMNYLTAGTDIAAGTPKTTGSVVDIYRYTMKTTGSRWLHFYWDAYGFDSTYGIPTGWAAQTGSIAVSRIVVNGDLYNP